MFKSGNNILDKSIIFAEDDQWKRMRSIMIPTFSTGKLRRMKPLIDDCITTMIENFENEIKKSGNCDCDVKKIFGAFSMDVVISVGFGTKVNSLIDENNPIIKNAKKFVNKDLSYDAIFKMIIILCLPKLGKLLGWSVLDISAANFFKELLNKIVDERKKNYGNVKRYDFLQLMMEAIENKESDVSDKLNTDDAQNEEIKFVTHNKSMILNPL